MNERQLWTNTINMYNDEKFKTNGSGFICNEHFSPDDIILKKGHGKIKDGIIPSRNLNVANNCEPAILETHVICSECISLKKELFKSRADFDIELRKKSEKIEDLILKMNGMKSKIFALEQSEKTHLDEINRLREKQLSIMNITDIEVRILSLFNYQIVIMFCRINL